MKITIDTNDLTCKVGSKTFGYDMPIDKQNIVESYLREFLRENTKLTDYEEDCAWMSWRYCIGRHTIASHMHAHDIWVNCKGRTSPERQLFNAFDINREIERCIEWRTPNFHFPITSLNRIYSTAVDIVCEFLEEYNINSIEEFLKYKKIDIILTDNERGYKFEPTTWEEWLRPQVHELMKKWLKNDAMSEDDAWNYFNEWKEGKLTCDEGIASEFAALTKDIQNPHNYYMHDFEDLFVWNDLVHAFDYKHHHKSVLIDGSECEWFWSWTNKTEQREDGYYYRTFGYKKIRVPVDSWNGSTTTWIPDKSIINNIY